ncbi:unnamed protein product [marine sediment metagenome]|uniref:Uncharacterized protein n=1 Tax=marine sediment metagenome TaxID=412755 RepID=X0SUW5_9ZZZZ
MPWSIFPDKSVVITILKPEFDYSLPSFVHRDALYYASDEIVFIATKRQAANYTEDVFTEIAIWQPEEIQLFGAITLSRSRVEFATWHASVLDNSSLDTDLSSEDVINECIETAKNILIDNKEKTNHRYTTYIKKHVDSDYEKLLFENIDVSWGLLLRGLYTLMKSELLMKMGNSHLFMEESFIDMQISCEAALAIIRGHLADSGISRPTPKDAYKYIESKSVPGLQFPEYLKDIYASWVETKHPLSDYGANWAPSIQADDVFETWDVLISIYRHIINDKPIDLEN